MSLGTMGMSTGKKYKLGARYFLHGGKVTFEKGGEIDVVFFVRPATEDSEEFKFNLPAKIIFPLIDALTSLANDSNMKRTK